MRDVIPMLIAGKNTFGREVGDARDEVMRTIARGAMAAIRIHSSRPTSFRDVYSLGDTYRGRGAT